MANYFVSYDLNGKTPTHAEMDEHLKKLGKKCIHRVLETVWYVNYAGTLQQLADYVNSILSSNDRLLVIEAIDCRLRNLLVPDKTIQDCWKA